MNYSRVKPKGEGITEGYKITFSYFKDNKDITPAYEVVFSSDEMGELGDTVKLDIVEHGLLFTKQRLEKK